MKHNPDLPTVVLDTCLYISFLANQDEEIAQRVQSLIEQNGSEHNIVLPAIVQAECVGVARLAMPKKKNTPTQRGKAAQIAIDFFSRSELLFAELDQETVDTAAELIAGYDLQGADATILATALNVNASYLYSTDGNLLKLSGKKFDLIISPPPPATTLTF